MFDELVGLTLLIIGVIALSLSIWIHIEIIKAGSKPAIIVELLEEQNQLLYKIERNTSLQTTAKNVPDQTTPGSVRT